MIQDIQTRKQYPSEAITEDPKRLETQIRVFKRWLNCLLKQANAREITDILDIFRDTENLYLLCKHLLRQKVSTIKEPLTEDASHLERAIAMLERLYGHEIATVMQTAVVEISSKQAWNCETYLKEPTVDASRAACHNLLLLGLDTIWILIVTVRAGTGPPSNLAGSISSSGSTITRRSFSGHSGSQSHSVNLLSTRSPCVDRWLISQDERLMAWCVAITEGYSGINVINFTHSWRDGLAFLAIVHQSRPDLFTYETRLERTVNQNLSLAFHLATAEFATPRLLEPVDMHPEQVDARATAAYILEFRKAVERDRKRRSRGILEIQTSAMVEDQANPDLETTNVTVMSRGSPTSTTSTSDMTWLDDELDNDSGEEGKTPSSLPDPDLFDSTIETTLAWLLAMEERFANNDLTHLEMVVPQAAEQFSWANYSEADFRKNLRQLTFLTTEERNDIEALLASTTERLKKLHQKIVGRVDEAMARFEVHEDLTAHMSRRQMAVGRCLRLGNRIIQVCRDRQRLEAPDEPVDSENTITEQDKEFQAQLRERLLQLDPEVIQRQTALLSSRWNNLCRVNQSLGRRITNCLLRRQGMLLVAIRLQLEKLEEERARQAELPFGPSIRELKSQLEVNRGLEEGIEIGEVLAERLDNFIMLVPLHNAEKAEKEVGLEAIITDLANRWGRLVEWVNTRYAKLQNALLHWRHFEEESTLLADWLHERAEEVSRVSAMVNPSSPRVNFLSRQPSLEKGSVSPAQLMSRNNSFSRNRGSNSGDESPLQDQRQDIIVSTEAEMEAVSNYINNHEPRWAQLLASLDRRAQAVREACGDTEEVSRLVEANVERLVTRWSQLDEPEFSVDDWMDRYTRDEDDSPKSEPNARLKTQEELHKPPNASSISSNEAAERERNSKDNKGPPEDHLTVPKGSKFYGLDAAPPSSPTGYRAEFEAKAEELLNWLENSAEALELVTMDKNGNPLDTGQQHAGERKLNTTGATTPPENPIDVTNRISIEVTEWRETMEKVLTMGERYREELFEVGESVEELDQLFDEVEERWGYLTSLLAEAERHVRITTNSAQFHEEVSKLLKRPEDELVSSPVKVENKAKKSPDAVKAHPAELITEQLSSKVVQLQNQLAKVEEKVQEALIFSHPDDLEDQLSNARTVLEDLLDEHSNLANLLEKLDATQNADLINRTSTTINRLKTICSSLKERLGHIQELSEQVDFFMNQLEGIEKWLADMRDYLESVSQAVLPSTTVIQAQLQESCEALKDMETLEPTLRKVTNIAKHLQGYFKEEYQKLLFDRLVSLQLNWDEVKELTKSNREHLGILLSQKTSETNGSQGQLTNLDAVEHSHAIDNQSNPPELVVQPVSLTATAVVRSHASDSTPQQALRVDVTALERWMTEAKEKLAKFAKIESQAELNAMEHCIKSINDEISERRYILAALDTHVAVSMDDQPLSDTESLLTRAHFADLESAVAAERERLRGAVYYLEDFSALMNGETRWFESVLQHLDRLKSEKYGDLSEFAEDLESLNRLSEEHSPEDEERLKSLAKSLTLAKVMNQHVQTELETYNQKLVSTNEQMKCLQKELKCIVDCGQDAETKTQELESLLNKLERELLQTCSDPLAQDAPTVIVECNTQINACKRFVAQLEQERSKDWGSEVGAKLLQDKLEHCQKRLETRLKNLQTTVDCVVRPTSDLEPRRISIKQRLNEVEQQIPSLDIISCTTEDLSKSTEKVKDLLTRLNDLKAELDQLQKNAQASDKKATESSERLSSEIPTLQDQHRNLVMTILTALGRLEDALPLSQKLEQLVTTLINQVDSVEEVTDYLETADCPMSRKDMVQSVYASLQKLCAEDGVVGEIMKTMDKLKKLTTDESSLSSSEHFADIQRRIEQVMTTKEVFRSQVEKLEAQAAQHVSDSCSHPQTPSLEHPMLLGIKPSVSELIESLVKNEAQTPPLLRQLAREIKDHLKSVVLFYRHCLGTNAPLPSLREEGKETTSDVHIGGDYTTTIAERKAIVQIFFRFTENYLRQQKTHLGDRLRELIVNAGGDGMAYRLQDLLSLQTVWHETNEKLDRRGEHMATLEQQLTAADEELSEYLASRSTAQQSKCLSLLKRLEDTYGWNLTADHELLSQPTSPEKNYNTEFRKWRFWDGNLVTKYESQLRTLAQLLNAIHIDLTLLKRSSLRDLGGLLKGVETRFSECCQLAPSAEQTLNQLNKSHNPTAQKKSGSKDSPTNISGDDLLWLKVLLEAQKNRFDDYTVYFNCNKNIWQYRADQWDSFYCCLNNLKAVLSDLQERPDTQQPSPKQDIRGRLQNICGQFEVLRNTGRELLQTDLIEETQANGFTEQTMLPPTDHRKTSSNVEGNPPAVPPRRNSLKLGKKAKTEGDDRVFIQQEINAIHYQLQELCRRYNCLSLLSGDAAAASDAHAADIPDDAVPPPTRTTSQRSAYVNLGSVDDEGPHLSISTLEELGSYRNDVEACLRGLAEETHWLIDNSGLVPKSLVRRKSDDIRLTSTPRSKPTTEAELRLDLLFWHRQTGTVLNGGTHRVDTLEFAPSWLKAKWAELEALIEVTFEHEKQANTWCRKAIHLIRLLRECEGTRTKAAHSKVITRLEASCNRLTEALSLAQTALRRRKLCLTRWQSQLVELDTLLAEIKTLMGSYETTGWGIRGETPSDWLSDLRQQLTDPSREESQRGNRDHWLVELDPRNSGLGSYLDTLSSSWNKIQAELATTEQSVMKVQVPEHIASQIRSLLTEWEMVCVALNLQTRGDQDRTSTQQDRPTSLELAPAVAVVCAPNSWTKQQSEVEALQSPIRNSLPKTAMMSGTVTASESTSPTLTRIRAELEQLSRWLTAVANFSMQSRVKLGDRFDQEIMNSQLLHAKLVTSEGSRMDIAQIYHPAALQLKIQQFLTELEARKPRLDRISIERDRLGAWNGDETLAAELSAQAENLSELWTSTEDQMQHRARELEEIIADTQKLKELEREVDRWLTKAEADLDGLTDSRESGNEGVDSPRRLPISPDTSRRRLQELNDSLASGREKLDKYTREVESLMDRFQSEDTSKIREDLVQLTERWHRFNNRLQKMTASGIESANDDVILDSERIVLIKSQPGPSVEPVLGLASSKERLADKLDIMDRKVNRIAQIEIDLKRQQGLTDETVNVTEQRAQLITELQALQIEINNLSSQITGSTRPSNQDVSLLPDSEFLTRWRQLRDKIASLRQTIQSGSSQPTLFLARLKELNNWVAHRDAAFRATISPLTGNLLFVLKLRETMLNLFKEIETRRTQIEDALQQGRAQYGEERMDTSFGGDSELESDASDIGVRSPPQRQDSRDSGGPGTDDQSKRTTRRIRRYLYHLKKRWLALNTSMLEYKQQLDTVSDRLSTFQSMFNDVVEQVRSAHAVALRWMPVDCLPIDRIGMELEQAQAFYEACDPLVILLHNLDRQIVQFHDSQIALDPHVLTQQAALRNDFDQVRYLTETRIRALSQTLVSIHTLDQRTQPTLSRSPSHRTPIEPGRFVNNEPTETVINGKMESPMPTEFVSLSDSVSQPWERCVHPSGTQVPYYKNHATQDTQWDHPILSELMQSMKQMNAFRFAEYRTALKLRKLQKTLCLDSLSISILAENLKHIGHSQPIDGHNTDPFDRTINVPQMIDCLLDLFSRANGTFGVTSAHGTPLRDKIGAEATSDWNASPQKTSASAKYSTLPSTRYSDIDLQRNRGTPTKCGKRFRRHSSAIRDQQRASVDPSSARPLISSPVLDSMQQTSSFTTGNRCASMPENVTMTATPIHQLRSDKKRRSTRKNKHRFLVGPTKLPVNVCVDLTLNWLLNVYDRMRKGSIRALSFKIALTTLSVANLDEKYRYLFSLIADANGCVTEQRLHALLAECILIPRNLGEGGWIGKEDFVTTVKHCFEQVAELARSSESGSNFGPRNIPVRHFLTWLRFGPKTIIWLPLLHRIMLAEQVVHNVRCGVCQRQPLTGLRYRCLRCLNFDLCQQCFFCGWTARNHKLSHPMQEYCTNSTSGDSFRDFTRIVRNRLRSRDRVGQRSDSEQTTFPTRYSRGRSTCCDANSFGEDKPRPAPTFGSDLVSLLPRDSTLMDNSPLKRNEWPKGEDVVEISDTTFSPKQARAPPAAGPVVSRPSSSQIPISPEHRLPPRAASDTRQFQVGTRYNGTEYPGRSTFPKPQAGRLQKSDAIDIDEDEHGLIAQYSQELRQQSEPELNPVQKMVSSTHSAVPTLMDRSTISDGLPCMPGTTLGNDAVPVRAGHLSLDRRQLGRLTGGQPFFSNYGPQNGSLDVPPSYYPGAPYPHPQSSNPMLARMNSHEPHLTPNIQRSYSLRARSQPPPDVHAFRQNMGINSDPRSPYFSNTQPINYLGPADQTLRTLEDERKLLQQEYDRLRQRNTTPTYAPSSSTSRLQTQQAQQRFARMQLQHQLIQQQQQQDAMRANLTRPYLPRIPLHRPPSVGSSFPSGPLNAGQNATTGRFTYGGSLGRGTNTSNGFAYLVDTYGSEPRVGGYPYGFEAASIDPIANNQSAVSSELAIEARRLREHRGRLEVRMQQLEDQNKQLENKLQRLRQYLISGGTVTGAGGTNSANKIPVELLSDRVQANSKSSLRQRSASGGLTGQLHSLDGKVYRGSGSVGQLVGQTSLETKQSGTKTPVNSINRPYPERQSNAATALQDYYQVPVDDSFPVLTSPEHQNDDIQTTPLPTLQRSDSIQY